MTQPAPLYDSDIWVILQLIGYSLSQTLADSDMTSISTLEPYMSFQLKHASKIINWHAWICIYIYND